MVSQNGITLAVDLIAAHFGDLVAKVSKCLLQRGGLTLQEVARFTELQSNQVKNCLLVLIQHNCVQAFLIQKEGGFGMAPKTVTQYAIIFDNILHRMRFPKFMALVAERLDSQCEALLEGLLQHGRLTLEQLIQRATTGKGSGNTSIQSSIRTSFERLVHAHFVERCPTSEPTVEQTSEKPTKRRHAKVFEEVQTVEQQAIIAAVPLEAERFSITSFDTGKDTESTSKDGETPSSRSSLGMKRKHEVLSMDEETLASLEKTEVLWRVNFEEFVRCLRNKACVENVRSRFDLQTGVVLEAMLEATRFEEKKVKLDKSVPLSLDTILQEVRGRPEGLQMTLEHIRSALDQLDCRTGGMEGSFSVDLRRIIEFAQDGEVESIVRSRYGVDAYRIFRLLRRNGCFVETDRISDITFLEKKDASAILYKLWKDEFLHMEKIMLQSRHIPLLLWKMNRGSLWNHVLDQMYHTAFNLSQRIAYELEQEHEVIELPRNLLNQDQEKRLDRIRKVKSILEASLLKLDDTLMLFHDF